jgi:hypothetical protein
VGDGLGTMQNKFLLNYAAEAYDLNPAKRQHRNLPDKPDYFNAQNFIKSWVNRFVDLPVNVLFTVHAMHPEVAGEEHVYPSIQGKGYEVSNYVCGLMTWVAYMEVKVIEDEIVRRLLWKRTERNDVVYFAKDQTTMMPTFTDDLSMPEILGIMDSTTEGTKPKKKGRK